jgi:secreted trypsin-like serine protease
MESSGAGIVGGTSVPSQDAIAQSSVLILRGSLSGGSFSYSNREICSGSLIGANLVVTAAHCLLETPDKREPLTNDHFFVYLGNLSQAAPFDPARLISVSDLRVHPGFTAEYLLGVDRKDVALLKLTRNPQLPFRPALLLTADYTIKPDSIVTIAGFGNPNARGSEAPYEPILKSFIYRVLKEVPNTSLVQLKAVPMLGANEGDSGGPAFVEFGGKSFLWGTATGGGYPDDTAEYEDLRVSLAWLKLAARQMASGF